MEPLNITNFEIKRDGANASEIFNKKNSKEVYSTKNHREIVLNNINMMMKWAYENK